MAGAPDHELELVDATAAHDWTSPAGRTQFARGPAAPRRGRSHASRSSATRARTCSAAWPRANALAVVPADVTQVAAGDVLRCHPLGLVELRLP